MAGQLVEAVSFLLQKEADCAEEKGQRHQEVQEAPMLTEERLEADAGEEPAEVADRACEGQEAACEEAAPLAECRGFSIVERCVQRREVRGSGCDAFDEAMIGRFSRVSLWCRRTARRISFFRGNAACI